MATKNRLDQILRYIEQRQRVDVEEISRTFDVSPATARRDLDQLSEAGKINRIHGGATAMKKAPPEQPVLLRGNDQAHEKALIGETAAALVNDGDTILMGGGTTVLEVARHLTGKSNLTVITNSLLVVNALSGCPEIHLFILGGFVRHAELLTYGLYTDQILSDLYVDKVFLGIRAISIRRGLSIDFLPELSTERLFLKKGKEIVVVADHTKFNREATSLIGPLTAVHHIVTDNQAPEETIAELRSSGIQVLIAESKP